MSNKPKTYVAIILDKSGSMSSVRKQAVQDYNEQIQQMKENAKEQEIKACLLTFNGSVFEHTWLEDVSTLEEATVESYIPNGGTAMYDALGHAVSKLQDTVTDKDDENVAFLIITISDGEENSSRHYNSEKLRTMISGCQETNRWTFTYMGCSEDYLKKVSKETNIPLDNMAVWSNSSVEAASLGLSSKTMRSANYFSKRASGQSVADGFYSDVKGLCANYDPNAVVNSNTNPVIGNPTPVVDNSLVTGSKIDVNQCLSSLGVDNQLFNNSHVNNVARSATRNTIKPANDVFQKGLEVKVYTK
jgi:uncharacterized protein YegL